MVSAARPLEGRRDLEALFGELGRELSSDGTVAEVVLVGGSWLLWHQQRAATRDVDSAQRVNPAVAAAVRRVADRHGLAEDWLNDRAAMFWPADADLADCRVVYEAGGLTVKVPAPEVVFVMKLYRASPQDHEDMILLWPSCGFESPGAAAEAFWRAYPHAPEDPHLADYVSEIATAADAG